MIGLARRLGLAVATGYIFVYFSEYAFWARPLDGARFPGALWLLLIYSLLAYAFLTLIAVFRARTLAAVFLCGALFGWLDEGVVVQTLYGQLPLSVSFTGLAWHALITVLVGWLGLQGTLRARAWRRTALAAALVGLGYGLWAIWWWVDSPPPAELSDFAVYVSVTTLLLMAAYWLVSRPWLGAFAPTRVEVIALGALVVVYFAVVTVPAQPLALVILPPLATLALLTLWRNRRVEAGENAQAALTAAGSPRLRDTLPLLLIPTVAVGVYALALAADARIPTGWGVYIITTSLGSLLFIYALVAIWRVKPPKPDVITSPRR